jgi:hypothetical protein
MFCSEWRVDIGDLKVGKRLESGFDEAQHLLAPSLGLAHRRFAPDDVVRAERDYACRVMAVPRPKELGDPLVYELASESACDHRSFHRYLRSVFKDNIPLSMYYIPRGR